MIEHLPIYITAAFVLTTILTLLLFIWAVRNAHLESTKNKSNFILVALLFWLIIQAVLTMKGIYKTDANSFPPKIMLMGIFPAIVTIILLFATTSGRDFIDSLPLKHLTLLHIIRIPVEIVLYWLFLHKAIPELMTFEGRNFDIIAGLTAPVIVYLGFTKQIIRRKVILLWNIACLVLLMNIVINALLSTTSPIQQFAFDQPNIAILHFPFSWLPTFIVPIVVLGHLTSIRQLITNKV